MKVRPFLAAAVAVLLAVMLAFAPSRAHAATVTLTYTAPTTYAPPDGSAIPAGDLTGYRVAYGLCPDAKTLPASTATQNIAGGATLTYTVTGLQDSPNKTATNPNPTPVIYCFVLFAESAARGESQQTNVVSAPTPALAGPNPPGSLAVSATTAYQLKASPNGPRLASIGEVPLDTPCDANTSVTVNGATYFAVPSLDVSFSNNGSGTRSTIYAQCGPVS